MFPRSLYCSLPSSRYTYVVHQFAITSLFRVHTYAFDHKTHYSSQIFLVRFLSPTFFLTSMAFLKLSNQLISHNHSWCYTGCWYTLKIEAVSRRVLTDKEYFAWFWWRSQTSQTITCHRITQVAHHYVSCKNSPASNVDNSRTKPKRQPRCLSILEL